MYSKIHQFEPLLPEQDVNLVDLAEQLIAADAKLSGGLHVLTKVAIADLVRSMNCYYSNLIEGHKTLPEDIEKALRNSFSGDKSKQDLQHLALAHIDTEKVLQAQVRSGTSPYSAEFIAGCHKLFCDRLPESMLALPDGDVMIPGAFRTTEVFVGDHVAPAHGSVPKFMRRFEEVYSTPRSPRSAQLIAIAAAHHRLVWIHPFADGNGRVSRLVTGAMLKAANINHDGLWSLSRGLAKSSQADASDPAKLSYKAVLHNADAPRMGLYDGRGNLSAKTLGAFCAFVLKTAVDQAAYMSSMVDLTTLSARFANYFERARSDIRPQAIHLIVSALAHGEIPRGEADRITGLQERVARGLLGQLVDEGFLVSSTPKGPVHVGFPVRALGYVFPNLYPEGSLDTAPAPPGEIRKGARPGRKLAGQAAKSG